MASFLEELGKTLADKGKEAADKAREVTEVLQLKAQINSEKNRIKDAYSNIGRLYYEKHKDDEESPYAGEFAVIFECLRRIEKMEEMISKLEGTKTCPECGEKVPKDATFCSRCGRRMNSPVPAEEEEM